MSQPTPSLEAVLEALSSGDTSALRDLTMLRRQKQEQEGGVTGNGQRGSAAM